MNYPGVSRKTTIFVRTLERFAQYENYDTPTWYLATKNIDL